jgi:hypothetical protein
VLIYLHATEECCGVSGFICSTVSSKFQHSGSFYSTKKCATSEWFTFIQWDSYFVHKFHKHRIGIISQCGISVNNFVFFH